MAKYPFTHAQEHELIAAAQGGDIEARDKLVLANLGIAHQIAIKMRHPWEDSHELAQDATLGLFKAVETYDLAFDVRLATYAYRLMVDAIVEARENTGRVIRLPSHAHAMLCRVAQTQRKMEMDLGRRVTLLEVSDAMLLKEGQRITVDRGLQACTSYRINRNKSCHIIDLFPQSDSACEDPVNANLDRLAQAMETLTEKERLVIRERFGLDGKERKKLRELGVDMHITRERVRQIEKLAIEKLKRAIIARKATG